MVNTEENKKRFLELLQSIDRPGMDGVIKYLANSDFFTAPASTKFHMSVEGGLVQHSLNVYDCLMAKKQAPIWKNVLDKYSNETLTLVSLLHDVCKANTYITTPKNIKSYEEADIMAANPKDIKSDSQGQFVWKTVLGFAFEEQMPIGHGEKSVIILLNHIRLTTDEMLAIRWHMGFAEPKEAWNSLGKCMDMSPLVIALHHADMEAQHLIESKENNIREIK